MKQILGLTFLTGLGAGMIACEQHHWDDTKELFHGHGDHHYDGEGGHGGHEEGHGSHEHHDGDDHPKEHEGEVKHAGPHGDEHVSS